MIVLIDGNEVECNNDVKVIWDDEYPESDMELHVTVTSEGVILDRFTRQDDSDETGLSMEATASMRIDDLDELCH